MIKLLRFNENDEVLHKKSIDQKKLKKILEACPEQPTSSTTKRGQQFHQHGAQVHQPSEAQLQHTTRAPSGPQLWQPRQHLHPAQPAPQLRQPGPQLRQPGPQLRQPGPQFHQPASPLRQPWRNRNPFVIVNINNRIKKCAGCPFQFEDPHGPPFIGVVIRHAERNYFPDRNGQQQLGREANRYYHCEVMCLLARHYYFQPCMLQEDAVLILNDVQRAHLTRVFNYQ